MAKSKVDSLTAEQRRELDEIVAACKKLFKSESVLFTTKGPENLTVRSRIGGGYSKRPYIGGAILCGCDAYLGKSGRVILVFQVSNADEVTGDMLIEMPLPEATTKLDGFPEFSRKLARERLFEEVPVGSHSPFSLPPAASKQVVSSNPLYGSW